MPKNDEENCRKTCFGQKVSQIFLGRVTGNDNIFLLGLMSTAFIFPCIMTILQGSLHKAGFFRVKAKNIQLDAEVSPPTFITCMNHQDL